MRTVLADGKEVELILGMRLVAMLSKEVSIIADVIEITEETFTVCHQESEDVMITLKYNRKNQLVYNFEEQYHKCCYSDTAVPKKVLRAMGVIASYNNIKK